MAKVAAEKQINSFVKGLITEANPLTYPENASLDEDNFVLKRNGSRSRRLGIDFEPDYTLIPTGLSATVLGGTKTSFHKWEFPGGSSSVNIGVVRVFNKLWFVNLLKANPSANLLNSGASITISGLNNAEIEVATINNYLVLVSEDLDLPVLLSYNPSTDTVSQETISLKVRDLWGVYDGLAIDQRPTTLSATHKYNLRNQGWSTKISSSCGTDAIDCTYTSLAKYPSNADIWTLGKVGDSTDPNFEKYSPAKLVLNSIDNSAVSRGSYIIDAFDRGADRVTLSGISGLPTDRELGNITTVASYAGRIFYSGITSSLSGGDSVSPNYSGYLLFSQIITAKDKLGKCYQEADPTSPNISDIVDTDGGAVHIPEVTKIVKIISTKSSLLVLAENGVWELFGDTQGFVATSYQVSKISEVGISNPKSVVNANGSILYWAKAGIYALVQDAASGRYTAQSLSISTVQTYYSELSEVARNNAKVYYDERENCVRWCYNDTGSYSSSSYVNKYNRELVLDLTLQAFYLQSISVATGLPYIADYVDIPGYTSSEMEELVYVGSDVVQVGGVDVYITSETVSERTSQFRFLVFNGTSFTFAGYNNNTFKDWVTYNGVGVNFSSYLITGYEIFGDILRWKQVPYILFYFERTEDGFSESSGILTIDHPSSCLVQSQWNWTDSANSGKWGTQFQAYKLLRNYIPSGVSDTFDYGDRVIVTKSKLRGSGRCLSLKIQSEEGKDMKLLGWALLVTGDSHP